MRHGTSNAVSISQLDTKGDEMGKAKVIKCMNGDNLMEELHSDYKALKALGFKVELRAEHYMIVTLEEKGPKGYEDYIAMKDACPFALIEPYSGNTYLVGIT